MKWRPALRQGWKGNSQSSFSQKLIDLDTKKEEVSKISEKAKIKIELNPKPNPTKTLKRAVNLNKDYPRIFFDKNDWKSYTNLSW